MNMNRSLLFITSLVFVLSVGCSSKLPPDVEQALDNPKTFKLFSLSPRRSVPGLEALAEDSEEFHGWRILGSKEIKDVDVRSKLIAAFKTGVAENNGTVADCFNPRHGIRVTHKGKAYDFVICFECYQVKCYMDEKATEDILISSSPQAVFDKILADLKLPLAPK